jgi:hypothetical protein
MAKHAQRRPARGLVFALTLAMVAALATGTAAVSAAGPARLRETRTVAAVYSVVPLTAATATCKSSAHPKLAARLGREITDALRSRGTVIGLAMSDARLHLTCKVNQGFHFDAASVIKATIISALLLKKGGPSHLSAKQKSLAWAMITESNNNAVTALWDDVGMSGMQRFLDRAKMTHTHLNDAWGLTQITAQDEVTLLKLLTTTGKVLTTASRRYALYLMAHVIASERWGTPAGAPSDVTVHVKNGWLPYPVSSDWHINSIGAFTGHDIDYQIAVLTSGNPSMDYGIDTIEAAARVINRELAEY